MAGNIDLTKLKWIKNVRHQEPNIKWAYTPDVLQTQGPFLHWKNKDQKNAEKRQAGDLILLKQNNCITHLVKILDNEVQGVRPNLSPDGYDIYRQVEIIWMTSDWEKPPRVEEIFKYNLILQGGKVFNLETSKTFQKYWNQGHGGLSGFQEHIRQVLKLN